MSNKPPTLPATQPQEDAAPPLDAPQLDAPQLDIHGFDPHDFDWIPVARHPRSDGWTPRLQKEFIAALADTGSVTQAARAVGMSVTSCYRLRRAPSAESFARAWESALEQASKRLIDLAFDRAFNGTEEPVLDKHGNCIYIRQRTNDRLLMFLLRHHHPGRYNHARYRPEISHQHAEKEAENLPETLSRAINSLGPVPPDNPHLLMDKEDFSDFVFNAGALDNTPSLAALSSLSEQPPALAAGDVSANALSRPQPRVRPKARARRRPIA
jgi:hypothetical protein